MCDRTLCDWAGWGCAGRCLDLYTNEPLLFSTSNRFAVKPFCRFDSHDLTDGSGLCVDGSDPALAMEAKVEKVEQDADDADDMDIDESNDVKVTLAKGQETLQCGKFGFKSRIQKHQFWKNLI